MNDADRKRAWAKKNANKIRNAQKRYREKNKTKLAAKFKEWRKKNRGKRNAQARREYERRRDHYITYVKKSADKANPARIIRRLSRQFKNGDIGRDRLITEIARTLGLKDELHIRPETLG